MTHGSMAGVAAAPTAVLPGLEASLAALATETRRPAAGSPNAYPTGDIEDFNFLFGNWSVANRRLRTRGQGADDWESFAGISRCEPRLGHAANVEEISFPTLGWSGLTLRLFDRASRRWSIYWVNSGGARLFPPVQGGFIGMASSMARTRTRAGRCRSSSSGRISGRSRRGGRRPSAMTESTGKPTG